MARSPRMSSHALAPWRRWSLWLVLSLLLSLQGLGQWHRIAHAQGAPAEQSHPHSDDWGHAAGGLDCQQLDHQAHDGAPPRAAPLLLAAHRAETPGRAERAAQHAAPRWARSARAPPGALSPSHA